MGKTALTLALTALAAGAAAGLATAAPTHAARASITVGDDFYSPTSVQIARGKALVWRWHGSEPHSVSDSKGKFSSKIQTKGSYSHKFKRKGTYHLYCKIHPDDMNMTVVVS
jgi:plastocyanin